MKLDWLFAASVEVGAYGCYSQPERVRDSQTSVIPASRLVGPKHGRLKKEARGTSGFREFRLAATSVSVGWFRLVRRSRYLHLVRAVRRCWIERRNVLLVMKAVCKACESQLSWPETEARLESCSLDRHESCCYTWSKVSLYRTICWYQSTRKLSVVICKSP